MVRTRPPSARGATRWLIAGAVAGLLLIACMFALRVVFGAPTLPELVEDLVIALIPDSLFGFVVDRLQFAAKPLLLVGVAALALPLGAAIGWLYGRAWPRHGWARRDGMAGGLACGVAVWLALEVSVFLWGIGANAAVASAGSLLASAEVYGIALIGLARVLEIRLVQQGAPETTEVRAGAAQTTEASAAEPAQPLTMPAGVAAEVTPNDRFYIVSKNFNDPRVSADKWSLQVFGWWRSPRGSHMRRPWRYRE